MEPLSPQQQERILAQFLDVARFGIPGQVVSLPFGKLGTTPVCPVAGSDGELFHGESANPIANEIFLEATNLTSGVYDVWWDFGLGISDRVRVSLNVETDGGTKRYGTGFTCGDSADGGNITAAIALMVSEEGDAIRFRSDNLHGSTTVYWNAAIVRRLP